MEAGVPARLTGQQKPRREWLLKLILLTASLVVALAVSEVAVRVFFPINDGRANVTLAGEPITEWFAPGSVYRQLTNEYDAITTITAQGHRVPGTTGSPDVVFVGDSFTYGYGLKDDETFASLYCAQTHITCANLGMPGSGTARQVDRLRTFIERYGWRPREVKFFFFGMSGSFSAGNDFVDNYNHGRRIEANARGESPRRDSAPETLASRVIGLQSSLMEYSYLVRRAKYHWGPLLKSLVVNDPGTERMQTALDYTRTALQELDALSHEKGFAYRLYLIVPVQDLIRKSQGATLAALNSVAPQPAVLAAPTLSTAPTSFYYPFDGHLNPAGSREVAKFLLEEHR